MPRLFYTGANDVHQAEGERLIVFQRADDAPLPYAEVTDAEAAALLKGAPDVYALAEGPDAEEDAPKPGRRKKAAGR